jgi:diacylglycerol kinase (ATP)
LRAYVIVNRRAGRLIHSALLEELLRTRRGLEVVETWSLADLEDAALAAMSRAPAAVVLAGGDGTYMAGVSALAAATGDAPLPAIALAPGGTVGIVARNWGMSGDPVRYARRLLDAIADDTASRARRPTLRVRDGDGTERIGFIFGTGLVARFFERYDERGAKGNVDAARIAARVFGGSLVGSRFAREVLEPMRCELAIDDAPLPFDRVSLLCASVVRDLGLKLRLTYRAAEELDRFHVVATPLGPRSLGPQMPLVLAGRPLVGPRADSLAAKLEVRFASGQGAWVLDGELIRGDLVTVTAGPSLELLLPG